MSEEEEYTVRHIEVTGVDAESEADAREKAMSGLGYGWRTEETAVEKVGEEGSAEPVELTESETDILRRGGSVEVGGQVITLDENAEDKHGLGEAV